MPGLDRSAAFWLRAYPRRWWKVRAAEITELLTDLAPTGATRLDLRTAAGLVRAGWATRWRQRPPVWAFLVYRLTDRRPDARYDGWLRDDVEGALYPWRVATALTVLIAPAMLALPPFLGWSVAAYAGALAVGFSVTVVTTVRGRAERLVSLFGAPAEIGPMLPYRGLER